MAFVRSRASRLKELPGQAPLFPLPGALLLPGAQMPLNIFEPRYLKMVDDALAGPRLIGMIQPRNGATSGAPPLYEAGCAGRITSFSETDDGRYLITLTGVRRFRVADELETGAPYRIAALDWSDFSVDAAEDPSAELVDRERLVAAMRRYLDGQGLKTDWEAVETAPTQALIDSLAMGCPFAPNEKQALLEAVSASERADCLIALMEMAEGDAGDPTNLQ